MGKTCDQWRTNLGKATHGAPLHRESVGHEAVSQAELLLQKQQRSLKKQLGSLEETREPQKANEACWAKYFLAVPPRLPDPRSLVFSGLYMAGLMASHRLLTPTSSVSPSESGLA